MSMTPSKPRLPLGLALLLVLLGCNQGTATPGGTVLARASLEKVIPPQVWNRAAKGPAATHEKVVPVGRDGVAEITVRMTTFTDPDSGGSYVREVEVVSGKNDAYELAAAVGQTPINRGTEQRPLMSIPVSITHYQKKLLSSSGGSQRVELIADGRIETSAP